MLRRAVGPEEHPMPWKVTPVSELRIALVHCVRTLGHSVAQAARDFDVSRKTANKWLAVYDADPVRPLLDRSRRPGRSPHKTDDALEQLILDTRKQFNWGRARSMLICWPASTNCPPSAPSPASSNATAVSIRPQRRLRTRNDSSGRRPMTSGRSITKVRSKSIAESSCP